MMRKNEKQALKEAVVERIKTSKALVFADYKGVTMKDFDAIRKSLRESGSKWQVLKKTILGLALKDAGIEADMTKLEGQVGVAFSTDEVAAAKSIAAFIKGNKDTKLSILGGSLESKMLSAEEVKALAKLPSRDELRGMLVGTLQAPISGFVRILSANLSGLVRVLDAVAESKK
jgi:large subunit ribosomal protein L10